MPELPRFRGTVFRAIDPRWLAMPMSGAGAALVGGRFNPKGMPALYTSLRYEIAMREVNQFGPLQPILLVSFQADIADILDTRDKSMLAASGLTMEDLAQDHWRNSNHPDRFKTQAVGKRLFDDGIAGLIVPSFARGARADNLNLVLWRWGPDLPHQLRLVDDDRRLGLTPRTRA